MSEFAERARTIGVIGSGSGDHHEDVRDASGRVVGKATTDELGTTVTVRDDGQDVTIRPLPVRVVARAQDGGTPCQ